jgi:hypothetical protein
MKGWYDLKCKTATQSWHFAGRIESGKPTVTDPALGVMNFNKKSHIFCLYGAFLFQKSVFSKSL